MIQLDPGNVLLKPSHRKQLMAWLKRALRIGQRLGGFVLHISMKRVGRSYEVNAYVRDTAGDFRCRTKRHDLQNAVRELARTVCVRLHDQWLRMPAI